MQDKNNNMEKSSRLRNRITSKQLAVRIDKIIELLCKRSSRAEIHRYVNEDSGWQISRSQIDKYISKAHVAIAQLRETDRDALLGQAMMDYTVMLREAYAKNDLQLALSIRRAMDKLLGLQYDEKARDASALPTSVDEKIKDITNYGTKMEIPEG